jgi:hypothetical protein
MSHDGNSGARPRTVGGEIESVADAATLSVDMIRHPLQ